MKGVKVMVTMERKWKKTRFCAYICKNWIDLHQTKQKIINPFYTNMIQIRPQLFVVSCEPKLK